MRNRDKFALQFFENIFDNVLLYAFGSVGFLIMFSESKKPEELFFYFIVIFSHLTVFTSIPMNFSILDKNTLVTKIGLSHYLWSILNFFIGGGIIFIFFGDLILFPLLTGIKLEELLEFEHILVIFFIVLDFILLKKIFSNHWHVANEHDRFKYLKKPIHHMTKKLFLTFLVIIMFHVVSIPLLKMAENYNFRAFYITSFLCLTSFDVYDSIKKDDTVAFKNLDPFAKKHSAIFEWYNAKVLLNLLFQFDRTKFLKHILGDDLSFWDQSFCNITEREKCSQGFVLKEAYRLKPNGLTSKYLIENYEYTIGSEVGSKILLHASQRCHSLVLDLISKGFGPKVSVGSEAIDVLVSMQKSEDSNCRDIVARYLDNHK